MIEIILHGLQAIGLFVIAGGFACIYMALKRKEEREWEKRDEEVLEMLKRRNSNNVDEATTGHNIRGCKPNHHGKRD